MTMKYQLPVWQFTPYSSYQMINPSEQRGVRRWYMSEHKFESYKEYILTREIFKKRLLPFRKCLQSDNGYWFQRDIRADDDLAH